MLLVSHGRSFSFYFIYNDGKFLEEEMWFYFGWFFHHVLFIVIPEFLRGEQAALFFFTLKPLSKNSDMISCKVWQRIQSCVVCVFKLISFVYW